MVVASSLMLGMLASAPGPVLAAAYTYPCSSPILYDYQHYTYRADYTTYHAVIGDSDVRTVTPCTGPASNDYVWTGVLPANLQDSTTGYIVQVGYVKCFATAPETGCGSGLYGAKIPPDGNLHFWYTCNALSYGDLCRADNWGTLTTPTVGHRYRFRIDHTGSSWKFTITDKGTGATGSKTISDGGWSLGDAVWWGVEGYDIHSMLGPKDTDSDLHMYWLQYQRNGSTAWWVAHPIALSRCELYVVTGNCSGGWPSFYHGSVYNQNYTDGDAMNYWTTSH